MAGKNEKKPPKLSHDAPKKSYLKKGKGKWGKVQRPDLGPTIER
jgi:hypothetical protein